MRRSQETDRTQVATGRNSPEHLHTLEEKNTNAPTQPALTGSNLPLGDDRPSSSENDVEDIEKGVVDPPAASEEKPKDPNLIEFDGPNDPGNPQNWPERKKWLTTISMGLMTFCVTFASSVFSKATVPVAKLYNVGTVTTTLGTSLFILGFALGPLIFGPGSELFGRKRPLFFGYIIFAICQIPVAVAQNLHTVLLFRFLGGVFGSAPLAIVGGTLADFFGPVNRGVAVCVFAASVFLGPALSPIIGGFITQSYLGWRWTAWITLIMAAFFGSIGLFVIDESYPPVILQQRAKKIRFETQNWGIYAKHDTVQLNLKSMLTTYLIRPFHMIAKEPILVLITLYMALIYGILYLFFGAYPISFQEKRGMGQGVGALPFVGLAIGILLGCFTISWTTKTRFARKLQKHGRVIPEERLPPMILGGFLLPIGLFWFAWTSNPNIHWAPQVIAGVPCGWGILMIFLQGMNYLIDVYMWHANSALAANTFLRSLAGAGFPLFTAAMYHKLGVAWATSLLAFLCVAMIPAPILFFIYGEKIRKMSKYSPSV